ncbi:hypothetical protein H6G06_13010 [Anabaena sphaerica FACHB-251]|uniref:Uncharacterized protein n=1 Tax=Anabaena sphaerica FACHB-251 TaxID=2692883 RepID=A0A927A194_9NOST|nr:hypothetical protein [Anabaena sphaerica]MBD2294379.1 hypothetical protein [Anabaena sphaerica FACHB-251]
MSDTSNFKITIAFTDSELDDEEKNKEVQKLLTQMQKLDDVIEDVNRVIDSNPPKLNKAGGGFLPGLLTAQVNPANFLKLFGFLAERLGNKPIKLNVKAPDGREINLEASSKEEFEFAWQKAQDFINNK